MLDLPFENVSLTILVASAAVAFLYGLITRNYSTVDRLWSVLPGVWAIIWIIQNPGNTRMLIAGILVVAWCIAPIKRHYLG